MWNVSALIFTELPAKIKLSISKFMFELEVKSTLALVATRLIEFPKMSL